MWISADNLTELTRQLLSVFKKFLEYVERFDRYKGLEAATNVRNLLQRYDNLEPFEMACLANLCPADVCFFPKYR